MMRWMIGIAFLLLAGPALAEAIGPATVIDGDTLEVAGQRFDLFGIDAPEIGQPCTRNGRELDCGVIARSQLMDITAAATVVCRRLADGTARCFSGTYDIGRGMVYAGWALADPEKGAAFRPVERDSRAASRGLWRGVRFEMPWVWRARVDQ